MTLSDAYLVEALQEENAALWKEIRVLRGSLLSIAHIGESQPTSDGARYCAQSARQAHAVSLEKVPDRSQP